MNIEIDSMITGGISFVIILFVSFIIWFFKTVYSDHKLVFEYYTKNKEADIHKIMLDMTTLKGDMEKVESESKRYWAEQRERATNNYNSLLERINHINENNKTSSKGIIEYLERMEKKIERVEDKLDNKVDK